MLAGVGLTSFALMTHVALPGIDFYAFLRFLRASGVGADWWAFDQLSGGGLHRASIASLGFAPYCVARLALAILQRLRWPSVGWHQPLVPAKTRRRWQLALTTGVAMTSAYAFSARLMAAPDVVNELTLGFLVRTVLVLTATSVAAMALADFTESLLPDAESAAKRGAMPPRRAAMLTALRPRARSMHRMQAAAPAARRDT